MESWLSRLPIFRPVLPPDILPASEPSPYTWALSGKSGYQFGGRSLVELQSVNLDLRTVAVKALGFSAVDFGVIEGLRSKSKQEGLVASGSSQTLNSKHLTGHAIDVAAYEGGKLSWEANHYLKIATAFVYAAKAVNVGVRWGGAWHISDIRACANKDDAGETMLTLYKELRRRQGRKVFLDLGHFELA